MIPSKPEQEQDVTPRGVLEYLERGHNALIMRLLWENPVTAKNELAERDDELCSSVVARSVREQRVKGFVREHPGRGQYELTVFGELIFNNHRTLENIITRDGMEMITKSPCIIPILRHLSEPKSLNALSEADDIDVGERAISEHRNGLEMMGWIERTPPYSVSKAGQIVLIAYQTYIQSAGHIISQREFLQSVDETLPAATC